MDHHAMEGVLDFMNLPDIFQILGSNNSTGVLQFNNREMPFVGKIFFKEGNPVNAECGPLGGIDAAYALFGWNEGTFRFYRQEVNGKRVIQKNRMEIVLDALRLLDDGDLQQIGAPREGHGHVMNHHSSYREAGSVPVVYGDLVDYAYVVKDETCLSGDRIISEGAHGNWVWIVLDGVVRIVRNTPGGPVTMARLGRGSFVGTFTFFSFDENVRSATVIAESDVQLGLLDTMRLSGEFTSLSSDFRRLLLSAAGRLKKINDLGVDLFNKKACEEPPAQNIKVIVDKGSTEKAAFTITRGKGYVTGLGKGGDFPLLTLEQGDVFGYLPFLDFGHEPHSASVLTSEELEVIELDLEKLEREYYQLSGVFRSIIDNLTLSVSITTRRTRDLLNGPVSSYGSGLS